MKEDLCNWANVHLAHHGTNSEKKSMKWSIWSFFTLYMIDMAEKAIRFWSPLPISWTEKRNAIALFVFQNTAGYLYCISDSQDKDDNLDVNT